jgi:putative redox protein
VTSTEKISFIGSGGAPLAGVLHRPRGEVQGSAVLAHCFTCSKDLHTTTRLARALTDAGWMVLTFDFTGLGESEGDFATTTVTTDVGDITRAAVALLERDAGPCLLVGHSLGGAAAILAARRIHSLDGVVAIATPSDVSHVRHLLRAGAEERIREHGRALVDVGGRPFEIGAGFLDDLERHDVAEAAAALDVPLLVIEAGADTVVGHDQTARLAAGGGTLRRIDGADHLFTTRAHADALAAALLDWISTLR